MKIISNRVSMVDKDDVLSIVILPTTDKRKLNWLLLWLIAWSICGIIVLVNFFTLKNRDAQIFVLVYLSFWLYFEYKIMNAYKWKKNGKEKIWLKKGKLFYQKEIKGKGKTEEFDLNLINDIEIIELSAASFSDSINQSFWIKGGERIQFQFQAKTVKMGMQLSDTEAYYIIRAIKSYIKNKN